jgi:uncharacterized protein
VSFPALTAIGRPAVMANVTNTVALAPGYLGATVAQRRELQGQRRRLLLQTGERLFTQLVPFLILFASALLAVQGPASLRSCGPWGQCFWRPSTGASSAGG